MRIVLIVVCGLALAACAGPISQEAKDSLAKPVSCDTAEADIAALDAEKASVAKQAAMGVTSVQPAGAVMGILTRTTKDKAKVATGIYNREIKDKIAEIKATCAL